MKSGAVQQPFNEQGRLSAIRRYDILDTPPDGSFDRITALAARLFDVPIALVTIVDEDRIWFKSVFGLEDVAQIPRDPGLCASAICQDQPYIVEHARKDPRSFENPLVAGEFGLQFYAAAPLRTHDGHNLGTLCLLDRKPRTFAASDRATLEDLAAIVVDELELRLRSLQTVGEERKMRLEARRLAMSLQTEMLPHSFPAIDRVKFDAMYIPAAGDAVVGGDWYDSFVLDETQLLLSIGDVAGHGLPAALLMGKLRQSLRTIGFDVRSPAEILVRLDRVLRAEDPNMLVSAFVAIVNLADHSLRYASAGHPPPLLRLPSGEIVELASRGLPLGLRTEPEADSIYPQIPGGSVLVLYTDGLTESTHDLLAGERLLRASLANATIAHSDHPAAAIQDALVRHPAPDDVALLTLSFS